MKNQNLGLLILRLGLAAVFIWFGYSQITNNAMWLRLVPEWASSIMAAETIVMMNGWFEVVMGALLALGIFTRVVALILALHLIPIISALGYSANAVRDFGLAVSMLSLVFSGSGTYAVSFGSKPKQAEFMQ